MSSSIRAKTQPLSVKLSELGSFHLGFKGANAHLDESLLISNERFKYIMYSSRVKNEPIINLKD